jgi:uncharacterized protein YneF (UPF0154 family)
MNRFTEFLAKVRDGCISRAIAVFAGWLPLVVVLAIAGSIVLGAFPGVHTTGDQLAWLSELPVHSAYAFAVLGFTWLARRYFRRQLTEAQKKDFWALLMDGNPAAITVFRWDCIVWILSLLTFAWLLAPAR